MCWQVATHVLISIKNKVLFYAKDEAKIFMLCLYMFFFSFFFNLNRGFVPMNYTFEQFSLQSLWQYLENCSIIIILGLISISPS